MGLPELKSFLIATPFFGGLADAPIDRLIAMLTERHFASGEAVFREGEEGRSMYVVCSGQLVVEKAGASGRQIRMSHFGPGDFFGEMTLIAMQPRSITIQAESDAVLYELTAKSLYAYYKADVQSYVMILGNINRELCRRLMRADERITAVADASNDVATQIRRIPGRA
jgi:CRP/FNR family transcriptional regulator, cyclic AMP receptor protein